MYNSNDIFILKLSLKLSLKINYKELYNIYIMFIPFYFIENSWCLLEVYIKNNCYWIDWNIIYDKNNIEFKNKSDIILDFTTNKNILCLKDNNYFYYNTDNKITYEFNNYYNFISIDGSHSLESLNKLKNIYNEEFMYKIKI